MSDSEYAESKVAELESLLAEWDERFADVDLDADEVALAHADQLLDEYDRKKLVLEHDPRYHAACAAHVGLAAG